MDKLLNAKLNVRWKFWPTSTVASWSLGMVKEFHPALYDGSDNLIILGLKLFNCSEMGLWRSSSEGTTIELEETPVILFS